MRVVRGRGAGATEDGAEGGATPRLSCGYVDGCIVVVACYDDKDIGARSTIALRRASGVRSQAGDRSGSGARSRSGAWSPTRATSIDAGIDAGVDSSEGRARRRMHCGMSGTTSAVTSPIH